MPSTAALALLLALPLCGVAATAKRIPEDYATINGTIVDDSGQPAKDATVFVRLCETITDRQVVNVGKLTLRPGFSVSGKIVLTDRKDVPPGMHVTINPEWTVYNRLTGIAADGTFEIKGLAPDIYSLGVGITGYTSTASSPQKILVESDRRNVIIHMARSP